MTENIDEQFYEALCVRDFEFAKKLIKQGADIECRNKFPGESILFLVICDGNYNLFRFLVENGINIECRNKYSETPLSYCCRYGRIDMFRFLLNETNANIDVLDTLENNLLTITTKYNSITPKIIEIIKEILLLGVDPNEKNYENKTFLDYVSGKDKKEIEDFIQSISYGIKPAKK